MNSTLPAIFPVVATWYLVDPITGEDGPRRETTMIMHPGQDMVGDAPKIIAVMLWADNSRAGDVKVIALRIATELTV